MRRCIWFVPIGLLFMAGSVSAQVVFDAATDDGGQAFVSGSTFSHTVTGSNVFLLVSCGERSQVITSATYNGVALTFESSQSQAGNATTLEVWRLVAPATGAHNVVVTTDVSDDLICFASSFSGVDQSTPIGTSVKDTGAASSHAHDTTSQTNGLVWDVLNLAAAAGAVTVNGGQTLRAGRTTVPVVLSLTASTKAGATTVNTGYSWVSVDYFNHITVPIKPAAADTRRKLTLLGIGP